MRHRTSTLHARLLGGAAALALAAGCGAASAQERQFNIPSQSLSSALNQFGAQSDTAVLVRPDLIGSKISQGVADATDAETALNALLTGTGLTYKREGDTFLIIQEGGSGPQDAGAAGDVDALIVTAQKKEEAIQDVPIAISAFTQKSLDAQKIEGGFDLLKAIPNVTFSKSNFSGYNFSIRGIGTKAVSATTDPGVAVSFNNTTLIVNRLFEQEYFDIERVEVLRGPQGTLYGRNATSGVINVLSVRPRLGEFEGDIKLEAGNYNAQRVRGMVNIPVGDTLALRVAGALTKRDGYGFNESAGTASDLNGVQADVDNRDLWSVRATLGWEPVEAIRANLLWERFEEDDRRVRTSKQLCHRDDGQTQIGAIDMLAQPFVRRALTSQGCLAGSLYDDGAFGTPNGGSLPYIYGLNLATALGDVIGPVGIGRNPYFSGNAGSLPAPCPFAGETISFYPINACQPDPYGGLVQSRDLRTIASLIDPIYRAKSDLLELSIDIDLTDSLTLTSQTVYATDEVYASQDYNRFRTVDIFNDSDMRCGSRPQLDFFGNPTGSRIGDCTADYLGGVGDGFPDLTPGGVFTDPQLGPSRSLVAQDLSQAKSDQFNQEVRLSSNFDAPFNFSLGGNITRFETMNDYYVFINTLTLFSSIFPFTPGNVVTGCPIRCLYIDPNPLEEIDGQGHNYFRSANPYKLNSAAVFGELYWQATDDLKVTLGGRLTWDRKVFTPIPSQLLLFDYRARVPEGAPPEACTSILDCQLAGTGLDLGQGAQGSPPDPDIVQEWREPTGRIIVDWKPDLGFTDETMVYGSISHGYKGGGANPPSIARPASIWNDANAGIVAPKTFAPEFINAFEVGTKNTLLGGSLVLNGSAFLYDYEGYQVSKIVDRSASNENFDARIWGLEFEWIFSPSRNLRFNGTVGHLRTEIADGERSLDLMDRTQGGGGDTWTDFDGNVHQLAYDEWIVLKPWVAFSSNCVAPVEIVEQVIAVGGSTIALCPGQGFQGQHYRGAQYPGGYLGGGILYDPQTQAPNGGAGFLAELGGNELPNAPHWTASLGGQYRMALPGGWDATLRGDFYWQSQSYARVYNTQYDKLRAWTNTNISLWVENPDWGVTAEVYVKNVFDETPITDAFLNSDDSGLTTNVFTLDPRLVGVSVRKSF